MAMDVTWALSLLDALRIVLQRTTEKGLISRVSATHLYTKPNGYRNVRQNLRIKNLGVARVKSGCELSKSK